MFNYLHFRYSNIYQNIGIIKNNAQVIYVCNYVFEDWLRFIQKMTFPILFRGVLRLLADDTAASRRQDMTSQMH